MKKVVRLTESDLMRIVKRVINESDDVSLNKINNSFNNILSSKIKNEVSENISSSFKIDKKQIQKYSDEMLTNFKKELDLNKESFLKSYKNNDLNSISTIYFNSLEKAILKTIQYKVGVILKNLIKLKYNKKSFIESIKNKPNKVGNPIHRIITTVSEVLYPNRELHRPLSEKRIPYAEKILNWVYSYLY